METEVCRLRRKSRAGSAWHAAKAYARGVARDPRIEIPGGFFHLVARGNRGCVIYEDDFERRVFLSLLRTVIRRFEWTCHSFVLMSNHFHLLIQLQPGGLSDGMQLLNGAFAKFSNRRHG
jgi:REP-associated tyrosine transposase